MKDTPHNPTSPTAERGTPASGFGRPHAGSMSAGGSAPDTGLPVGVPRLPSLRVTAMLAAGMLALGVAAGAAIGPAPDGSLADVSHIPALLPSLAALAAGAGVNARPPARSHPVAAQATQSVTASPSDASASSRSSTSSASSSPASSSPASPSAPSSSTTPTKTAGGGAKQTTLPAITSVWLIELSGANFTQARAQSGAAPYIDSQLVPAGTLLSGWSAADGSAFASEASLLAGTPPQTLDTIVQPPCPEGQAGAQCAPETAGALTAADGFLQQTIPTITASTAYRTRGLIVVTFGAVSSAAAGGLPAGSATATLSTQPPAGVVLISPFARVGTHPSTPFNPTSPRQSLEKLLHQ
jgi:hypothetical protein